MRITKVRGYSLTAGKMLTREERRLRTSTMRGDLERADISVGDEVLLVAEHGDGWIRVRGVDGRQGFVDIPEDCLEW